jgi:hypothetical protein
MTSVRAQGWALYDEIVATAAMRDVNPWIVGGDRVHFQPDYSTLPRLLGVPALLRASTQSGVPALAFDVWVSYELRRAGFDADRVWPRPIAPRVMPAEVLQFIQTLPKSDQTRLHARILSKGSGGSASANLLGKNYVKQVDVVMSSWATGPELMISTKRMDSSFGKNAANRVEESYGDAKNLRLRYPRSALGFVYGLSSAALTEEPDIALWLIDLLGKLGREDDAYDAVALVIPDLTPQQEAVLDGPEPGDVAGPLDAGAEDDSALEEQIEQDVVAAETQNLLSQLPEIGLRRDRVPPDLDPGRFFEVMCSRVLDNSPINFHREARRRRLNPQEPKEPSEGQ